MTVKTQYLTTALIPQLCGECGTVFGMPDGLRDARLKDGLVWWCPLGHQRVYTNRRELQEELNEARGLLAGAERRGEAERRSHSATKGHLTRTKRRANAGVCLDCHRFFKQVERHRERMHPGLGKR